MAEISGGNGASNVEKKMPILVFLQDARKVLKMDALGLEILRIAFPAALALAADPIASLIDTAFIGRLGAVEIAAVGVSIAIFNQASKVTIFPLVSITTSFVAEEDTVGRLSRDAANVLENNNIDKTTTFTKIININDQMEEELNKEEKMGGDNLEKGISVKNDKMKELKQEDDVPMEFEKGSTSETKDLMLKDDLKTLANKSPNNNRKKKRERRHIPSASTALVIGTVLGLFQTVFLICLAKLLLGLMGVKSGSPMLAPAQKYLTIRSLGAPAVLLSLAMQGVFRGFKDTTTPLYATGDVLNIILDPILIFACHLGVSGAAIAHVISQYLISVILFCKLVKQVDLLPPSVKDLQFGRFLKNGKGFNFVSNETEYPVLHWCVKFKLAILACAFAEKDYDKATRAATRVLQMSFVLGLGLAVVVGLGLQFGSGIFSKDKAVIHVISIGVPFVAGTQPLNSMAFVFDGVNFGASDFVYSAYSMVLVAIFSIASLLLLCKSYGFVGIWVALTIYMALRTLAGVWRMGTGTGPWRFLRGKLLP
ncbi:hypothetical protein LguiA_019459 [Lonicera macranthoides]